jgi:hypothetical protein
MDSPLKHNVEKQEEILKIEKNRILRKTWKNGFRIIENK